MKNKVRKSVIAGTWYPDDPGVLRREISGFLEEAKVGEIPRKPLAIISPHAGYIYSGRVAAHAYKTLKGHAYSTVVVISPSHRTYFPYVSVWPEGFFETPLGRIEVDETLCRRLIESSAIFTDNTGPHDTEHALEIQLPFLQAVLPPFKLCPLIMGSQDLDLCRELGRALRDSIGDPDEVLVTASSDLSHFHKASEAKTMDARVARRIEELDVTGLARDIESRQCEACGGGPVMTAIDYALGLSRTGVKVLDYAHSGHITGDNASVVGYLSAVIY